MIFNWNPGGEKEAEVMKLQIQDLCLVRDHIPEVFQDHTLVRDLIQGHDPTLDPDPGQGHSLGQDHLRGKE